MLAEEQPLILALSVAVWFSNCTENQETSPVIPDESLDRDLSESFVGISTPAEDRSNRIVRGIFCRGLPLDIRHSPNIMAQFIAATAGRV